MHTSRPMLKVKQSFESKGIISVVHKEKDDIKFAEFKTYTPNFYSFEKYNKGFKYFTAVNFVKI